MRQEQIAVVLVDDEAHCTGSLAIHLNGIDKNIHVLHSFNKAQEALVYLQNEPHLDILFLDIEMPGVNGFELLKQLDKINFEVVFVTAYNQYAINAFKYSAFDYLLKPVEDHDLLQCIERWEQKKQFGTKKTQLDFLTDLINRQKNSPEKLALPTNEGLEFIEINNIIRCQSDSNYTNFHLSDGSILLICRTLKDVESSLQPHGFIRIHQSHLVNPKYMTKLIKNDGGYLIMTDNSQLRISKHKKELIVKAFNLIS